MSVIIDTRTYDRADQERFAELSGDRNAIHLDPVAARRELFGGVVVHGLHILLRALDQIVATRPAAFPVQLRGSFPNPTFLGEPVTTSSVEGTDGTTLVAVESGGLVCLQVAVTWEAGGQCRSDGGLPAPPPSSTAEARLATSAAALAGRAGRLALWLDAPASKLRFPRLHAALGPARMAELLALTRLIGMECPGRYSIFSGFDLRLTADAPAASELAYDVERVVASASFVKIRVAGGGLAGVVDAFVRPPPQEQASFADVQARVTPGESAGQRAIVVGGSRGLGEVTAKLVAAGGAAVTLTYHAGRADAERVAAEIVAGGGRCDVARCDVGVAADVAALAALRPTQLYYFASPKIFVKRAGPYDRDLHARFAAVYVDAFRNVVEACRRRDQSMPLRVFLPSTSALDQPVKNLEEYADAKAAAEACAAELARHGQVETIVRRLPRIATDQSLTLVRHPAESALDVMLGIVREMNRPHV